MHEWYNTRVIGRLSFTVLTVLLAGCPRGQTGPQNTASIDGRASISQNVVTFFPNGRTVRVRVDVQRTPEELQRGLMFRKQLAASDGMLFIFPTQKRQSFWMKNTYIPLDMIFIDESRNVVGVVQHAEPLTTTSRYVDADSRFVVEVNAGFCSKNGIKQGTAVQFDLSYPIR